MDQTLAAPHAAARCRADQIGLESEVLADATDREVVELEVQRGLPCEGTVDRKLDLDGIQFRDAEVPVDVTQPAWEERLGHVAFRFWRRGARPLDFVGDSVA